MRSLATTAWALFLALAGLLSAYAVASWIGALVARVPVLYGEGAVANAARLALDRVAYLDADATRFVAANYPPLYLHAASLGDPFVLGRVISIAATAGVAALIYQSARAGGTLAAAAITAGWLALAPVAIWGPAVKPDLLALFLTALAVVLLDRRPDLTSIAGFALVLAALAKPTALIPAAALAGWLALDDRTRLSRFAFGAAVGLIAVAGTLAIDSFPDVWRHVVVWNALDWSVGQAATLALVGIIVLGATAALALVSRAFRGARAAYAIGGLGILVAGGRDGATINYLLDLSVAVALALGGVAPVLRASVAFPVLAGAQLLLGTLLLNPLRVIPLAVPTTGAWGDPNRAAAVARLGASGPLLVEDSGLLVVNGVTPVVDDLFLWSRLVDRGVIDAAPILSQAREARFVAVVSEADLERLDAAPAFERQRWNDSLVRAVLERYRFDRHEGALWIYVPR